MNYDEQRRYALKVFRGKRYKKLRKAIKGSACFSELLPIAKKCGAIEKVDEFLPEWAYRWTCDIGDKFEENKIQNILPESEIKEIRSALNFIDADDRDMWIRIGIALKSTGSPSAEGLWNEYSQRSDKYNPKDQACRWRTFKPHDDLTIASVFFEAKKNGWTTTYEKKMESK